MLRPAARHLLSALCLACALLGAASAARAQAPSGVRVELEGVGQATQLRDVSGALVARRRLAQYLGASGAQLLDPTDPRGPRLAFRARLRLETDLGLDNTLVNRLGYTPATTFLANTLELMTLQVWGLGGAVDLELGRQVQWGPTGFIHFDGATVAVHTRQGLLARAFGGAQVTPGASTLNDPTFEGNTTGRDSAAWSQGVGLAGAELGWVGDRFALRAQARTAWFLDPPEVTLPSQEIAALPGTVVREQKLGAALYAAPAEGLEITANARYDAPLSQWDQLRAEVVAPTPLPGLRVGLGAERDVPTFQLDSLFNAFGAQPIARWRALASWQHAAPWGELQADASALWTATRDDPTAPAWPGFGDPDGETLGGEAGLTWRLPRAPRRWLPTADAWLRAHLEDGWSGEVAWLALGARAEILHKRLAAWTDHRLMEVQRPDRPQRSGQAWASAAGVAWTTLQWGRFEAFAELESTPSLPRSIAAFGRYRLTFDLFE